jgi:hypothetical protein
VLVGNADTNAAWNLILPADAPIDAGNGRTMVEGQDHGGDDVAGWSTVKRPRGEVLVQFHSGERGARLALVLATRKHTNSAEARSFRIDAGAHAGSRPVDAPAAR